MPFSRIAENRIREAIAEGRFDDLPGRGQPLDLEEYFKLPAELRLAYSILKNANCAPREVELLAEIARLERTLAQDDHGAGSRPRMERQLADRRAELGVLLERRARRR